MAAERTTILRPALARLPGGCAGIAARRGRLLVARAAPGAHLPRSSWIGPDMPVGARTGAAWSSTPGPEARGCVASAQPWFGRRAPCGQRTERACLQGQIGGRRPFREGAGGGVCAARAGAAAPGRDMHVKTTVCRELQALRDGSVRHRLARDKLLLSRANLSNSTFPTGAPKAAQSRLGNRRSCRADIQPDDSMTVSAPAAPVARRARSRSPQTHTSPGGQFGSR